MTTPASIAPRNPLRLRRSAAGGARVVLAWCVSLVLGAVVLAWARDVAEGLQPVLVALASLLPAAAAVLVLPLASVRTSVWPAVLAVLPPEALRQADYVLSAPGVSTGIVASAVALGFLLALVGALACHLVRARWERGEVPAGAAPGVPS